MRSFKGRSVRTVKVEVLDRLLRFSVGRSKFNLYVGSIPSQRFPGSYITFEKGDTGSGMILPPFSRWKNEQETLKDELASLVPIVWLPISRRLPVKEVEEERHTETDSVELVDLRLRELFLDLSRYQSGLNTRLSKRYKDFEHQVLSVMLYSKEHDQPHSILNSIASALPTQAQKDRLRRAFEAAGLLLDEQMQSRIDDHFAAMEEVVERWRTNKNAQVTLKDIFVFPLINRTKAMVEYADKLEEDRENIFKPLRRYEEIVNSFLNDEQIADSFVDKKSVKIDEE